MFLQHRGAHADVNKIITGFTSQAAWHRMENGPKSKNGKKLAKKQKMALGPKRGKNGPKIAKKWDLGSFFYFFAMFGPFFPLSG